MLDLGEGDDLVELAVDLRRSCQDGAVEVDVLAAVSSRWKPVPTSSRSRPGLSSTRALGRLGDAGKNLQERALPAPLRPITRRPRPGDLEGHVAQGPDRLSSLASDAAGSCRDRVEKALRCSNCSAAAARCGRACRGALDADRRGDAAAPFESQQQAATSATTFHGTEDPERPVGARGDGDDRVARIRDRGVRRSRPSIGQRSPQTPAVEYQADAWPGAPSFSRYSATTLAGVDAAGVTDSQRTRRETARQAWRRRPSCSTLSAARARADPSSSRQAKQRRSGSARISGTRAGSCRTPSSRRAAKDRHGQESSSPKKGPPRADEQRSTHLR